MEHDLPALKRTAYALGELEGAERASVEAELAQSPAARKEVQELRQLASVVSSALASERVSGMSEIQHLALESRIEQLSEEAAEAARARVLRQRMMFWIPTAIAACALLASSITLFVISLQARETPRTIVIDPNAGQPANVEPARPRTSDIVQKYNEHILAQPPVGTVAYFAPHVDAVVTPETKRAEYHAFHSTSLTPLSSFPLTFDPKTYAFVQQFLQRGTLPPKDAVHVEAMVNSYDYNVSVDQKQTEAVIVRTEISECPWRPEHRLARVVLRARDAETGEEIPVVAEEMRVRVEFNPGRVASYRLIGYENRVMVEGSNPAEERHDVRAGYTLTVLYEIVPTGVESRFGDIPGARLKYQEPAKLTRVAKTSDELFTVSLMYRAPKELLVKMIDVAAVDQSLRLADASGDFKFAAAVAQFGLLLMDSPAKGDAAYDSVRALANEAIAGQPSEQRSQFLRLVDQAEKIVLN